MTPEMETHLVVIGLIAMQPKDIRDKINEVMAELLQLRGKYGDEAVTLAIALEGSTLAVK